MPLAAEQRESMLEEIDLLEELSRRKRERKILSYYPEVGPLRRELYTKHQEFFNAGVDHRERLMLAANRIGKTEGVGGYECALHLTGWYPDWWQGRRFDKPISAWACGDTSKTVREILQAKLLGPIGSWGTGLLPGETIERTVRATGIADTLDTVYVRHKAGGTSQLTFKSYDQRREAFQGTEKDLIWLDEEPSLDIYTECLMRTMTNNGMVLLTFTPLLGMSEVVLSFLPGGKMEVTNDSNKKYVVMATWDDAPHLSEESKKDLWASIPAYQRDARSKGVPQLGSGAIFPVPESDFSVDPFEIPKHWPRGYGMDVGWNFTAAAFGALDRENDILYLTSAYKRSQAEPSVHVTGIKAPGAWLPGFIDPASRGRSQKDGSQLCEDYRALGLNLSFADNAVESGLYSVWERMSTGRLKVFKSLGEWFTEFRLYRRDERGKVVKENDHLMDATRYLESCISKMIVKPLEPVEKIEYRYPGERSLSWMGG